MVGRKSSGSRERFLDATAELLQRQGYPATGVAEIVERGGAPKGSLYFHFPGGKEQLVAAALERAGARYAQAFAAILRQPGGAGAAIEALARALAAGLEATGYELGCPIATTTLEAAATSEPIRSTADAVFGGWLELVAERLRADGRDAETAHDQAMFVLAAVEGGLILARAQRSPAPLHTIGAQLAALLDG